MDKSVTIWRTEWDGPIQIDCKNVSTEELERCKEMYSDLGFAKVHFKINLLGHIRKEADFNYKLPV